MIESGYNGGPLGRQGNHQQPGPGGGAIIAHAAEHRAVGFHPGQRQFRQHHLHRVRGANGHDQRHLVRLTYMDDIVLAGDMTRRTPPATRCIFAANYGSGDDLERRRSDPRRRDRLDRRPAVRRQLRQRASRRWTARPAAPWRWRRRGGRAGTVERRVGRRRSVGPEPACSAAAKGIVRHSLQLRKDPVPVHRGRL